MKELPYLYVTLYPLVCWLLGLLVGGGLGLLVAMLLQLIFKAWPAGRKLSMLLPWRAFVFALLWMLWSPLLFFLLHIRGLPTTNNDLIQIGSSLLLLTFVLTIAALIHHWFPSTLAVRLVSDARTLAVAAVIIATLSTVGTLASFVNFIRMRIAQTFETSIIWQGWLAVFLAMLAFDLLPGILQTVLAFVIREKEKPSVSNPL